jgi:hypothetical protein
MIPSFIQIRQLMLALSRAGRWTNVEKEVIENLFFETKLKVDYETFKIFSAAFWH